LGLGPRPIEVPDPAATLALEFSAVSSCRCADLSVAVKKEPQAR
jgi:hypothetical protein